MKWVAFAVMVLVLVCSVEAREAGKPVWAVKAGVSGAVMYGDDTGMFKTRYGGMFGASAEYPFTELISVQGELIYAMKGWKNDKYCGGRCEISHSISQIEVPVLLRLNGCTAGPGPYVVMGPALYIGVSDKFEVTVDGVAAPVDEEDFAVEGVGFGVVMGAGMEFPGESYAIFVEARGSIGATPAYEDRETVVGTQEVDAQNVTASLVVGVGF